MKTQMKIRTRSCALRSGSSGNAIYIESGSTSLLVDAGVNARTVELALRDIETTPSALSGLLITHEHSDHVAGVGVLMRRYKLPLYVNAPTLKGMRRTLGAVDESLIHIITTEESFTVGELDVRSFHTSHDAAESVGYRIESLDGAVSVCTDLGWFEPHQLNALADSRLVYLESNYDPAMLAAGAYPYVLKRRILGQQGHLSNDDCGLAMIELLKSGTDQFVLSHLSKDNNYPELAWLTVRNCLNTVGAKIDRDLRIGIAGRYETSSPIVLG